MDGKAYPPPRDNVERLAAEHRSRLAGNPPRTLVRIDGRYVLARLTPVDHDPFTHSAPGHPYPLAVALGKGGGRRQGDVTAAKPSAPVGRAAPARYRPAIHPPASDLPRTHPHHPAQAAAWHAWLDRRAAYVKFHNEKAFELVDRAKTTPLVDNRPREHVGPTGRRPGRDETLTLAQRHAAEAHKAMRGDSFAYDKQWNQPLRAAPRTHRLHGIPPGAKKFADGHWYTVDPRPAYEHLGKFVRHVY